MYDLEEQEQIDALKAWWKANGRLVVAVVIAGCVAAGAATAWQSYKRGKTGEAAQLYMGLEKAVRANDLKGIRETSGPLMDTYGSTPYAPMAALVAAKANYDAGDAASATAQLQWVVDHSRDEDTVAIARLRLAGVQLDQKKYDDALKLLDASHAPAFDGLYADRKGDVYVAQDKKAEARAAYKQAIDKLPAEGSYRAVVEIKLDALGGAK